SPLRASSARAAPSSWPGLAFAWHSADHSRFAGAKGSTIGTDRARKSWPRNRSNTFNRPLAAGVMTTVGSKVLARQRTVESKILGPDKVFAKANGILLPIQGQATVPCAHASSNGI